MSSPFVADAGGLPTDTGELARGRLLRVSGDLVALSELRVLKDQGVHAYIDLRGPDEDRTRLTRWARRSRIEYISIPIGVAGGKDLIRRVVFGGGNPAAMLELYTTIVDGYGEQLALAVDVMASGTPVAFGCAAGKDRTGVLAALVQSMLGVSDEDIARSYVESAPPLDAFTTVLHQEYDVKPWLLRLPGARVMLGATAPTMLDTLAHVRREHGSAEAYLLAHGLAPDSVTRLREALTT